jgi:hypothetical protein
MSGITSSTQAEGLDMIEMACEWEYTADFGYGDPEHYECGQKAAGMVLTKIAATIEGSTALELLWQVTPLCEGHVAEAKADLIAMNGKVGGTAILAVIDTVAEYHPDDCEGCLQGPGYQHSYTPFNHKREADRLAKLFFDAAQRGEVPAWEGMNGLAWDGKVFDDNNRRTWYHLGEFWVVRTNDSFDGIEDDEWTDNDGTYRTLPTD